MLVDTPANELHTEAFANESIALAEKLGVPIQKTIIKGEDLRAQGFGGIYNVGKAAVQPPIFVCLSHTPACAKESYAMVGKGIIFDTGAAACLTAFSTLVKSGFRENLHCLLCIAENNISPVANKPDDIITLLSGKTVEVNNTDAEGRLVLADGVFYAKTKLNAKTIIDVATLTGAQCYATGKIHGAILSNKEDLEIECLKAGRKSGDLVHALPYAPDLHFGDLKSTIADMTNVSGSGKYIGAPSSTAGLFIAKHIDFSDSVNWLHIDIAAPAWSDDRATGFGTSLLVSLLSKHTNVDVALAKEICEPIF
uniref:Cytosol aminopeptidase domain-containing protein n=1 Tax=Ditylenchus dipsaci TaxID=166011 RepID=A0A915EPT9_9BILA